MAYALSPIEKYIKMNRLYSQNRRGCAFKILTILEWIFKEIGVNTWNWIIQPMVGLLESMCECGIKSPGSISHVVSC